MKTPEIISVSYSFRLSEEIIRKILSSDLIEKDEPLHKILKEIKEVKSVKYPHGIKKDSIEITLHTKSIAKYDQKNNHPVWHTIAEKIERHIN